MELCIVYSGTIEAEFMTITSVLLRHVLFMLLMFTAEFSECSTEVISVNGGHRQSLFMRCLGQTLKATHWWFSMFKSIYYKLCILYTTVKHFSKQTISFKAADGFHSFQIES